MVHPGTRVGNQIIIDAAHNLFFTPSRQGWMCFAFRYRCSCACMRKLLQQTATQTVRTVILFSLGRKNCITSCKNYIVTSFAAYSVRLERFFPLPTDFQSLLDLCRQMCHTFCVESDMGQKDISKRNEIFSSKPQ